MRLPSRSSKAFTLIELIVVIVILGILALIAIPTFSKVIRNSQDTSTLTTLKSVGRDAQALRALDQGTTWGNAPQDAIQETSQAFTPGTTAAKNLTALLDDQKTNPTSGQVTYRIVGDDIVLSMLSASKKICLVGVTTSRVSTGKCFLPGVDDKGAPSTSSAAVLFANDPAVLGTTTSVTPTPGPTSPTPVTTPAAWPASGVAGFKGAVQFGTTDSDDINDMAVAPDGTTYVVGATSGAFTGGPANTSGNLDAFVAAYTASGTQGWVRTFSTGGFDRAMGVAVGPDGTVYVGGFTDGDFDQYGGGTDHSFVSAYTPTGTLKWRTVVDGGGGVTSFDVAVGQDGAAYLVGSTQSSLDGELSGLYDAFVARIETSGAIGWIRQYSTGEGVQFTNATVASDGTVYVAGLAAGSYPSGTYNNDTILAAYSPTGTRLWVQQGNEPGEQWFEGLTAKDGVVYAVGRGESGGTGDLLLSAYTASSGALKWSRTIASNPNGYEVGMRVAVSADNTIYVAGQTDSSVDKPNSTGNSDVLVGAYTLDGTRKWAKQYGTSANEENHGLAIRADGTVQIAGKTDGLVGTAQQGGSDGFIATLS